MSFHRPEIDDATRWATGLRLQRDGSSRIGVPTAACSLHIRGVLPGVLVGSGGTRGALGAGDALHVQRGPRGPDSAFQ